MTDREQMKDAIAEINRRIDAMDTRMSEDHRQIIEDVATEQVIDPDELRDAYIDTLIAGPC